MTLDPRKRRPLEGIIKDLWLTMGQEEELRLPCGNMDTQVAEIMAESTPKCWARHTPDPENHTNQGEGPHHQGKTLPFPDPKSHSPSSTREVQPSGQIKDAASPPPSLESNTTTLSPAL